MGWTPSIVPTGSGDAQTIYFASIISDTLAPRLPRPIGAQFAAFLVVLNQFAPRFAYRTSEIVDAN
jgi:hypothetical protein